MVYKFAQDEWTQFSGPDADHLLPGSFGTQTYDEDGNLVISEPCCGDSTLTWSWDGRALKMVMIKSPIVKVVPMDHLMARSSTTTTVASLTLSAIACQSMPLMAVAPRSPMRAAGR